MLNEFVQYPSYDSSKHKQAYAQALVPGILVLLAKSEFGNVAVFNRNEIDVASVLRRERWLLNFTQYAKPGTAVLGLLWQPGVDVETLRYALNENTRHEKLCSFAALIVRALPVITLVAEMDCDHAADICTRCGLEYATQYPRNRFDWENMQPRKSRHAGHGGVKPTQFEQYACGWLLKDTNETGVYVYEK